MIETKLPKEIYSVELDWPAVPDSMCDDLIEYTKTAENIWEGKKLSDKFLQFDVPEYFKEWLRVNLPQIPEHFVSRIQMLPGPFLPKHIDALRSSSFNFVLTDDDSVTSWYDGEKVIHSKRYKSRVWYQHQSLVLHGVSNINKPRIAITVFEYEQQEILKDYGKTYFSAQN